MNKVKSKKILFLGHLPPPWHGVSAINTWILNSSRLTSEFRFIVINLTTASSIADIGKTSLLKYFSTIRIFLTTLYKLLVTNPKLGYITLTPSGVAFFKDSIILLLLKLFRIPVVVHSHGKGITDWVNKQPAWVAKYYRFVLKRTHLLVLGKNLVEDTRIVYKDDPIILPNGIPIIEYTPTSVKNSDCIQLLYLSNLMKYKGVLDFVESLKILHEKGYDFHANIIGASGDVTVEYVKQLVEKYKLQDKVDVLGPIYNEEKYEYLYNSDVFVFPSYYEPFGLVILEAFQAGIPVIGTTEGCMPEIIENKKNGFIVETQNPKGISEALIKFIDDPDLIEEIGKRNKDKFDSKYTLEVFEQNLSNIFNKVLN